MFSTPLPIWKVDLKINKKLAKMKPFHSQSEDAFRLAKGVLFPDEGDRKYEGLVNKLKTLFERNEILTEKRYNFHKREIKPSVKQVILSPLV